MARAGRTAPDLASACACECGAPVRPSRNRSFEVSRTGTTQNTLKPQACRDATAASLSRDDAEGETQRTTGLVLVEDRHGAQQDAFEATAICRAPIACNRKNSTFPSVGLADCSYARTCKTFDTHRLSPAVAGQAPILIGCMYSSPQSNRVFNKQADAFAICLQLCSNSKLCLQSVPFSI